MSFPTPTQIGQGSVEHLDALKRALNTSNISEKKEVIHTLTTILKTYKDAAESNTCEVPDLPKIILQVDMIHAISQVMATSDAELFSCTLNLLNSIYDFPVLRGKLGIVVEAGLRVASMVAKSDYAVIAKARQFFLKVLKDLDSVPLSIQRQIISVYGKLPLWLDTKELLEWTQLILFCPSLLDSLPQKVYTDFVKVLIDHRNMDKIGCKCLTFLAGSFKKLSLRSVFEICTSNNDFLKLLNEQISRSCPETTTEEGFTELVCAFQIVHRYIVAADAVKEKVENIHVITWSLTRSIPSMMLFALGDSILALLTELLHKDFKTEVLVVEESDPKSMAEVLSTIHFVSLSSAHKAMLVESRILVWMFLYELFRFSDTQSESGLAFRSFKPELNPWNLLTFAAVSHPGEPLISHPIEFWRFVLEWVKLLSKHETSTFEIPQSKYSGFNYGTFVGTLQTRIRSENLQPCSDLYSFQTQSMSQDSQNSVNLYYSQLSIREKEEVIIQIGDICSKLSDSSIDWEPNSGGNYPASPESSDDDDDEIQQLWQEKEERLNMSTDSETCSESDLQLME